MRQWLQRSAIYCRTLVVRRFESGACKALGVKIVFTGSASKSHKSRQQCAIETWENSLGGCASASRLFTNQILHHQAFIRKDGQGSNIHLKNPFESYGRCALDRVPELCCPRHHGFSLASVLAACLTEYPTNIQRHFRLQMR